MYRSRFRAIFTDTVQLEPDQDSYSIDLHYLGEIGDLAIDEPQWNRIWNRRRNLGL